MYCSSHYLSTITHTLRRYSECHHCLPSIPTPNWVSVWIHTGHLHIHGHKMSKSLKNFISIHQYLNSAVTSHPGMDFRLFILHHKYNAHLTYTEAHIRKAAACRQRLENFVSGVDMLCEGVYGSKQTHTHTHTPSSSSHAPSPSHTHTSPYTRHPSKPCAPSHTLYTSLRVCQAKVDAALADDFDTPLALQAVWGVLSEAQRYMHSVMRQAYGDGYGEDVCDGDGGALSSHIPSHIQSPSHTHSPSPSDLPLEPLLAVRDYVTQLFSLSFGVDIHTKNNKGRGGVCDGMGMGGISDDAVIQTLVDFRTRIRTLSLTSLKNLKDPAHSNYSAETFRKILLPVGLPIFDQTLLPGKVVCSSL
ncbi:hypothetical protein EON65_11285, partial [archaeon]